MKVSIIIPVYNAENYLDECIHSALNQTYHDIEIIAVDDGSKDNSLEKLMKYSDKIRIVTKKNGGTATALNMGIKSMSGEWFKWLSADDVLEKNAIEVLVDEIKNLGTESNFCIFYSNYSLINENGEIIGEFIEPDYNSLNLLDRNVILLDHYYGNGTTSLIHKTMFDKFGLFDETIGFHEDYEFWLRCCLLNNCKLHLVPQKLARYRIHSNQLTKKKINEGLKHTELIRSMFINKLSIEKRSLYLNALKKYKKQKPLRVRVRRSIRDVMIRVLPKNMSDRIIQEYITRKKIS